MDNSPTALFDSYEQEFEQLAESIKKKLDADSLEQCTMEERKSLIRRVEMETDEADEMVSQMEIEVQSIPHSLRPQYQTRLRTAKADISRYKKQAKEIHAQLARSDLLSSSEPGASFPSSDDPYGRHSDRTRLLAGTSLLEDGSKRLQESHRLALETEGQGADILLNLRTQREQIESSRNTLQAAETSIDRASGTLKKMIIRMYQQRFVTVAIILVLVLLIGIIIWEKLS